MRGYLLRASPLLSMKLYNSLTCLLSSWISGIAIAIDRSISVGGESLRDLLSSTLGPSNAESDLF